MKMQYLFALGLLLSSLLIQVCCNKLAENDLNDLVNEEEMQARRGSTWTSEKRRSEQADDSSLKERQARRGSRWSG